MLLFFLINDLYFLILEFFRQMFYPVAELVIPIAIPGKEPKSEIKIHPVIVETKIRKCSIQFTVAQNFLCFLLVNSFFFILQGNNFMFYL